jgi:hypothetical protein
MRDIDRVPERIDQGEVLKDRRHVRYRGGQTRQQRVGDRYID